MPSNACVSTSDESMARASNAPERTRGPASVPGRFENYELMVDERGVPIELGRGAMGITYKAFDVDLRCPVTLKVISEQYVGDESARLRFLREARAAASVRHPNGASVFHLGRTGSSYFYAMEFVEGETLENLNGIGKIHSMNDLEPEGCGRWVVLLVVPGGQPSPLRGS